MNRSLDIKFSMQSFMVELMIFADFIKKHLNYMFTEFLSCYMLNFEPLEKD